ncbi:hypothetical protein [Streptomyces echinatus]|uniref:Uncharacterized protein n=1 Tax=Streptomyces echinatus TaxID=67293 RepID=A0A7W9Q4D1_9ACTN|nr:hypothetical protein [Streptomyces echinatus]MBB5932377.1 hypothetical protein [Streptomyces echinatus]
MTVDLSRLDVPLPVVEADACFLAAAARATDPKDQLVYQLDAWLVRHPEACATDADYPGWAEYIAAREADNRRAREASHG